MKICENCGEYIDDVYAMNGMLLCEECSQKISEKIEYCLTFDNDNEAIK